MNTQSHAILTFFLLRRVLGDRVEGLKHLNVVLFCGAVLPDAPIYVFFLYYTLFESTPQMVMWSDLYFSHNWQILFSIFHSFPPPGGGPPL